MKYQNRYAYYVAYTWFGADGNTGVGGADLIIPVPLNTPKAIADVCEALKDKNNFSNVILTWWTELES